MMTKSGLSQFIHVLDNKNEVERIITFVDPVLEITEVTDRVTKNGGKALLFENTGTEFPVLINTFGSDRRISMALGRNNLDEVGEDIEKILHTLSGTRGSLFKKLSALPSLIKLSGIMPERLRRKGVCQQVIHTVPDLSILPVLKCWPHDAGRFITLPMVHTRHPETGNTNVGMYRMQMLDKNTTAMHWQRHKTGAGHFEAWKKINKIMPVSVALGGDPVYTYCATAPLPENVDEYILAGFLRKKKVRLVKCITNDLFVPFDADIVIEGYIDPSEKPVFEGPFGDHTGFYSLADWYPRFHVTCITHSEKPVYPATIVGIPPQEDAWLIKANEKIFLSPIRITLLPEVVDFHMPDAGVAHNLVIVKISKSYPGQGIKVINSLSGAGQMMFTKYMIVVSGDTDIRNYKDLLKCVMSNTHMKNDLTFTRGPLDVLDHSSESFSFGGKLGIDATVKFPEELTGRDENIEIIKPTAENPFIKWPGTDMISNFNTELMKEDLPVLIISIDNEKNDLIVDGIKEMLRTQGAEKYFRLILCVDHSVNPFDYFTTAWQILSNTDPVRDHEFLSSSCLFLDGTIKYFRKGGFPRKWPNIVSSDKETIRSIDGKWESLEIGSFLESPSLKMESMLKKGRDEIID